MGLSKTRAVLFLAETNCLIVNTSKHKNNEDVIKGAGEPEALVAEGPAGGQRPHRHHHLRHQDGHCSIQVVVNLYT